MKIKLDCSQSKTMGMKEDKKRPMKTSNQGGVVRRVRLRGFQLNVSISMDLSRCSQKPAEIQAGATDQPRLWDGHKDKNTLRNSGEV